LYVSFKSAHCAVQISQKLALNLLFWRAYFAQRFLTFIHAKIIDMESPTSKIKQTKADPSQESYIRNGKNGYTTISRTEIHTILSFARDFGHVDKRQKQLLLGDIGHFPFTKNFGKFLLEISAREECVPFVTSSSRGSRGRLGRSKTAKGMKLVIRREICKMEQIFHWKVCTGKTRLPFQEFRLFRKFPVERTKKSCSIYIPTRISRFFW